jgi:hypothetical protein
MAYEQWNWSFFGYQRLDGGKPVQDWFDGLPDDAKKEAREKSDIYNNSPIIFGKSRTSTR